MRKLARVALVVVALVAVVGAIGWCVEGAFISPCPRSGPFEQNALAVGNKPPFWDRDRVLKELKSHHIPFREEGDQILTSPCGINELGKLWW
jgi:hypothetical protein